MQTSGNYREVLQRSEVTNNSTIASNSSDNFSDDNDDAAAASDNSGEDIVMNFYSLFNNFKMEHFITRKLRRQGYFEK